MALSISFNGFIYRSDDSISNGDVNYIGYFHKVNGTSSPSQFNTVKTVDANGFFSINLGDSSWLSQSGNVGIGDIVLIIAWTPTSISDKDSLLITEWSAVEFVLTSDVTYVGDFKISSNVIPGNNYTLTPSTQFYGSNVLINASGVYDQDPQALNHSFSPPTTPNTPLTSYHWTTRHGITINAINNILKSRYFLDFSNNPTEFTEVANKGNFNGVSPNWVGGNIFSIKARAFDMISSTNDKDFTLTIVWSDITPIFTKDKATINATETITFTNTSTRSNWHTSNGGPNSTPNSTTTKWEEIQWSVKEDGDVSFTTIVPFSPNNENSYYNDFVYSSFSKVGVHTIRMTVKWWDGFAYQTDSTDQTIEVEPLIIIPNFDWTPKNPTTGQLVTFTPSITGTAIPTLAEYFIDNVLVQSISPVSQWTHTFNTSGSYYQIRQEVSYNDGFDDKVSSIEKQLIQKFYFTTKNKTANEHTFKIDNDGSVYTWTLSLSSTQLSEQSGSSNTFTYSFTESGLYALDLLIQDSSPIDIQLISCPLDVDVSSSDGGGVTIIHRDKNIYILPIDATVEPELEIEASVELENDIDFEVENIELETEFTVDIESDIEFE